ncbi:MAG: hypothetical protein NC418_03145 [Muribaculaceae bacterium]|nr:hypothetical protein [Muribaculaceae bacterium]
MKTVVLAIVIVLVCVVLLGVKVLFVKGARFPSGHVGSSEALRRKGIGCASEADRAPHS